MALARRAPPWFWIVTLLLLLWQAMGLLSFYEHVTNGAEAMGISDETRSLEAGKSADFIVIDQNLFEVPVERIHKTRVLNTWFRGEPVFESVKLNRR